MPPCNIQNMLILKKYLLFISKSNFSGHPIIYLATLNMDLVKKSNLNNAI